MGHQEIPATQGVRFLRERNVAFSPHFYRFEAHGGTGQASEALGVSEHAVLKTLVMEADPRRPFLILMHGDLEVSTRALARALGVRQVSPCDVAAAQKQTGYTVGGISPFGTRHPLPVCVEKTVFALPRVFVNGGKRGFLVEIDPKELKRVFDVEEVSVGIRPVEGAKPGPMNRPQTA